MATVSVTYKTKKVCKSCVRMEASKGQGISIEGIGDYYIADSVLEAIGATSKDEIKVTFEKA